MAAYDPRDDIPEADRAEQERDVVPAPDEDDPVADQGSDSEIRGDLDVDPLRADEADQIEQAIDVPYDDDYERP